MFQFWFMSGFCEDLTNRVFLARNWSFDKCGPNSPSIVTFYYDRSRHSAIYGLTRPLGVHTWTNQTPASRYPAAHSLLSVQSLAEIHPKIVIFGPISKLCQVNLGWDGWRKLITCRICQIHQKNQSDLLKKFT